MVLNWSLEVNRDWASKFWCIPDCIGVRLYLPIVEIVKGMGKPDSLEISMIVLEGDFRNSVIE